MIEIINLYVVSELINTKLLLKLMIEAVDLLTFFAKILV